MIRDPADAAAYEHLPSVHGVTCALITDTAGRVLLVKPNYRDHWTIPGGYLEHDEPPRQGCARELHEELGLSLEIGDLLMLDWAPPHPPRPRPIVCWVFDAGTLTDTRIADIRLQYEELDDHAFVTPEQATRMLPANVAPRIPTALHARGLQTSASRSGT